MLVLSCRNGTALCCVIFHPSSTRYAEESGIITELRSASQDGRHETSNAVSHCMRSFEFAFTLEYRNRLLHDKSARESTARTNIRRVRSSAN